MQKYIFFHKIVKCLTKISAVCKHSNIYCLAQDSDKNNVVLIWDKMMFFSNSRSICQIIHYFCSRD